MSSTATHRTSGRDGRTVPRFGLIGVIHGELLCEAVDIHPGEQVLDVDAGDGSVSMAAALRWGDVTAVAAADDLLEPVRRVADAFGVAVRTQVADAADLPFEDDAFDVALSAFGAMRSPDHRRVADELVRVCRPAGRIGLVCWSPKSLICDVLRALGQQSSPPPDLRAAIEWGSGGRVRERFGNRISSLRVERRSFVLRHRSIEQLLEWLSTRFEPTKVAFASLDAAGRTRLTADLIDICTRHNRADDGTFVAPTHALEIVAVVR